MSASEQSVKENAPVTLSARALGNGEIIRSGTLFFTLNNKVLYSSPISQDGTVAFTTSTLPKGQYVISAVYRSPDIYGGKTKLMPQLR